MLDRQHLRILVELERQGSLTAASEVLCVTQPALSHSIKKLEQKVGLKLWEKEGRKIRLTQAGLYLVGFAKRVLPQFEHVEHTLGQFSLGKRGTLRIGMECHPCYQWLLKVVGPFLEGWPLVDVDVVQRFKFGGIGALFAHDIDMLVTPDPLFNKNLIYTPVFDYEQVLVVQKDHPLTHAEYACPQDLAEEVLITYPVEPERLDVFSQFLHPASIAPAKHKRIETTDIMLEMVAAKRGVAALPKWLVEEYAKNMPIKSIPLGHQGVHKKIHLGIRSADQSIDYINAFLRLAGQIFVPESV